MDVQFVEVYEKNFDFNISGSVINVNNRAEISKHSFEKTKLLEFKGPTISATCTISNIKETNFERQIGYIQTSKTFHESEYEHGIKCTDFQSNLLRDQDEVLDTDADSIWKPFYSEDSIENVQACKIPEKGEIKMTLDDSPIIKIKLDSKYGRLKTHRRRVQFFVYLVMRSKPANGEWKYDVLDVFRWFINFDWLDDKNRGSVYSVIDCDKTGIDLSIFDDDCRYTCNDDQVKYWKGLPNGEIIIKKFANYDKNKSKEELDKIGGEIKKKIIERNNKEKKTKRKQSSAKKEGENKRNKSSPLSADAAINRKKPKCDEAGSSKIH